MAYIHTTAAAVSRLKKQAKLLVRKTKVAHAAALDSVAQDAKYANWRHVLFCAERSGSEAGPTRITMASMPGTGFVASGPRITFIRGVSGSGKSIQA